MRTTCYSQHCHGHCRKNVYTITDIKKTTYQARKARNSKKGNKDLSAIPTFRTESETRASDRSPEFCNTTQELVLTVSRPNSQNYGQTRRSGNDVRLPKEFLWGILGTVKCHRVVEVNLSLHTSRRHTGEVEVQLQSFQPRLHRGQRSTPRPCRFTTREKSWYPPNRWLVGSRAGLGVLYKTRNLPPLSRLQTRTVQPVPWYFQSEVSTRSRNSEALPIAH